VVIENKSGANGQLGTEYVARSTPDGHTLLFGGIGALTIRPHLVKLPYDPVKDFIPISLVAITDIIIVTHSSVPVKTPQEFVDYARAHPGKVRFGTSGTGGPTHLVGELFKQKANFPMDHIPYKGDSAAVADVVAGQIEASVSAASVVAPYIKAGMLTPIAMAGSRRSPLLPDVPTISESLVPGFSGENWMGLIAPAGTPPAVIQKLSAATMKIMHSQSVRDIIINGGNTPLGGTPEEFAKFIKAETDKWGEVVRVAKVKVDD
jgi:tripartite-type tricarboxylate transporter receptor subunit TctC